MREIEKACSPANVSLELINSNEERRLIEYS